MIIEKKITNLSELIDILNNICSEIDNGKLEQFILYDDLFCTKEDIHIFVKEKSYPDFIHGYFREIKTGNKFLLEVETFHGIGGCLKRLDN